MRTNLLFKLACIIIASMVLLVHLVRKRVRA